MMAAKRKDTTPIYTPAMIEQLLFGQSVLPNGFGGGRVARRIHDHFSVPGYREAWFALKDELLEQWTAEDRDYPHPYAFYIVELGKLPRDQYGRPCSSFPREATL